MQAVEVALDAAMLVMQNGGSTVAADRTLSNVLKGYKKEGVSALWRLDFVALRVEAEGGSTAVIRQVGPTAINLSRASEAMGLAERLAAGTIPTTEFPAELERVRKLRSSYNRWVIIAAAAGAAGSFSQIAGGDWGSLGIVVVAAGVGQFFRSFLLAKQVAGAPLMLVSGILSALIAGVGLRLDFSAAAPATLIASVTYMFPGLPLINGFIDLTSQKYLFVGMQRMLNAAFLFLVLAVAIAFAQTLVL